MIIYLITIGFISILGQVVILRELNVAFYGIELIYILSIGIWLTGTAIGASAGRRSSIPKEKNIQILFCLAAILLISDVFFIRGIRLLFRGVTGGFLPFASQIITLNIAIQPFSILTGILFQWTTKRFTIENGTLAKAYSIESAGGVLGGLLSTLFLYSGIQNFSIALICSLFSIGVIVYSSRKTKPRRHNYLLYTCFIIILILFGASSKLDQWTTSWNHPYLLGSKDTPYNRVTITALENQISVFEDDGLSYDTESIEAEEFVQLSTLQTTGLNNVLVLGGGFEGILFELLKLHVKKIDYVEINKSLIETIQNHLPPHLSSSLTSKKVNIIYEDPRRFLYRQNSYDVIIVGMPEPTSAQSNRFYTKEFFDLCSKRTNKGGVLTFKVNAAENLWTKQLQNRNRSIYSALNSVFNNIVILPGTVNIFIASNSALTTDPGILIERFNKRGVQTKLVSPPYINYIYTNDRFAWIKKMLLPGTAIPNSDLHPACYSYTMSIWLSKFFSDLALPDAYSFRVNSVVNSVFFWIIIIILSVILVSKKLIAARRFVVVTLAGLIGMVLEILLILNYQSKNGILYRDIGILLMTFMIGLTLGSFIVNKFLEDTVRRIRITRWWGVMLLAGFAVLAVLIYYLIIFELSDSLVVTSLILIIDGSLVSSVFAFISITGTENRQKVMLPLYSADLIGGSIGSLLSSLFLIPIFGLLTTSLLIAIVALLAIIFLK